MFKRIKLEGGWFIETWYNQHSMSWVSALKDSEGTQIGDACYDGHSDSVPSSRNSLIDRYANESGFVRPEQFVNSSEWGTLVRR